MNESQLIWEAYVEQAPPPDRWDGRQDGDLIIQQFQARMGRQGILKLRRNPRNPLSNILMDLGITPEMGTDIESGVDKGGKPLPKGHPGAEKDAKANLRMLEKELFQFVDPQQRGHAGEKDHIIPDKFFFDKNKLTPWSKLLLRLGGRVPGTGPV